MGLVLLTVYAKITLVPRFRATSIALASLVAAVLAALVPAPTRAQEPSPPLPRYVVAAIGDSLSQRDPGGHGYLDHLQQRCPSSSFYPRGISSQRVIHMRWRFMRDVFGIGASRGTYVPPYSDVIILGGINDLAQSAHDDAAMRRVRDHLSIMYAQARDRGLRTIALTVPPWTKVGHEHVRSRATRALNSWIQEQHALGKVHVVVDTVPVLGCGEPPALCESFRRYPDDLTHWSAAGHRAIAESLHTAAFSDCN